MAQHCDELGSPLPYRLLEPSSDGCELRITADHGRVQSPGEGFSSSRRQQPIRWDALGLALQLERLNRLHLHGIPDQAIGGFSDQDLTLGRGLLQTGGNVHGVAGDQPLPAGDIARDHFPSVHSGPVGQPHPPAPLKLLVDLGQRLAHLVGGSDRPQGVVFMRPRQPEDGHDGVTDVLLHGPAVALQDLLHSSEVVSQDFPKRLRVEALPQAGRALEVTEDDGDRLARLLGGQLDRKLRTAEPAQPEAVGVLLAAAWTDLHVSSLRRALLPDYGPPPVIWRNG